MTTPGFQDSLGRNHVSGFGPNTYRELFRLTNCEEETEEADVQFVSSMCELADRLNWGDDRDARKERADLLSVYCPDRIGENGLTTIKRAFSTLANNRRIIRFTESVVGETSTEYGVVPVAFKEKIVDSYYQARGAIRPFWFYRDQFWDKEVVQIEQLDSIGNFHTRLDLEDLGHVNAALALLADARRRVRSPEISALCTYLSNLFSYLQFKYEFMIEEPCRNEYLEACDPPISRKEARDNAQKRLRSEAQTMHGDIMWGNADSLKRGIFSVIERAGRINRRVETACGLEVVEGVNLQEDLEVEDLKEISRYFYLIDLNAIFDKLSSIDGFDNIAWLNEFFPGDSLDGQIGSWQVTNQVIDLLEDRIGVELLSSQTDRPTAIKSITEHIRNLVINTIVISGRVGQQRRVFS